MWLNMDFHKAQTVWSDLLFDLCLQFVSDYSGQHSFMSRVGPDGLHIPEKEATVSNILQIIRCAASLDSDLVN